MAVWQASRSADTLPGTSWSSYIEGGLVQETRSSSMFLHPLTACPASAFSWNLDSCRRVGTNQPRVGPSDDRRGFVRQEAAIDLYKEVVTSPPLVARAAGSRRFWEFSSTEASLCHSSPSLRRSLPHGRTIERLLSNQNGEAKMFEFVASP